MKTGAEKKSVRRKKYRLLYKLEGGLEVPMFLLSLFWLYLLIVDLVKGMNQLQTVLFYIVWGLFILEYLLKLWLAPRKWIYIKHNWLTLLALVIPALRVLRVFYALRLLQSARFISSTNIIRALTSGKRFLSALKEAQGPQPEPEMNAGILIEYSRPEMEGQLRQFAARLTNDIKKELEEATLMPWHFDITDPSQLESDTTRRPSDFLDDASMRMAEGPYDLMLVLTDISLMSHKNRVEAGFTSEVTRVMVISTRSLVKTRRNQPSYSLGDDVVRWNAAALFLHLLGPLIGLNYTSKNGSRIMAPYSFRAGRNGLPSFTEDEKEKLMKRKSELPERELRGGSAVESLIFHVLMCLRHLKQLLQPLVRNKALLMPLYLPRLVTAAVAPAFILVFTAEIWDVGLNMMNNVAVTFAIISTMGASFYLVTIQSLFLPRKEKRILTEHLAVANGTIYLSIFFACIGLFLLVSLLMLFVETYLFPSGLIQTWPTLGKPEVNILDKVRLAAFISTVGVTTGALAGGFESRELLHHLVLFKKPAGKLK
jgi:hypothetical protein